MTTTNDTPRYARQLTLDVLDAIPAPSRMMAPFQWFGGKGPLAHRIVPLLPPARVYVEPYAGAASVFWHLPRPYPIEVLNDLDGRIVRLFRVLQDREQFDELCHRLVWTPYARAEFRRALAVVKDPGASDLDRAWAFFVTQNQGFSGNATCEGNWGRSVTTSKRGMANRPNSWRGRLKLLRVWHARLSRVQIDSVDALSCIDYWDTPETVFYLDPPYVGETRVDPNVYEHEADDDHHRALVNRLLGIQGRVVLSGYDHPIYAPLTAAGWHAIAIPTVAHAAGCIRGSGLQGAGAARAKVSRTEMIWTNLGGQARLPL